MLLIAAISAYCLIYLVYNAKSDIIDGSTFIKITRDKFPSYIDIGTELKKQCGGVLLDKCTVLTSADQRCNQTKVRIMYIDNHGKEVIITSRVAKFISHENRQKYVNKIAIIKLKKPIKEVKGFIEYAHLPNGPLPTNATCVGVGFGAEIDGKIRNNDTNDYVHDLHLLNLNLTKAIHCLYNELGKEHADDKLVCAIPKILFHKGLEVGSNLYFTGGPLYCSIKKNDEVVYGLNLDYILSTPTYIGRAVFILTLPHIDWIKKHLHHK